jgi:ankyrin repeat protein
MTKEWLDSAGRDWVRAIARSVAIVVGLNLAISSLALGQQRYPGEHWEKVSSPESLGWSSEKLQAALEYADSIGSAAVMVIVDGLVLAEFGETARRFRAHSMRKSLVSALIGIYVGEGDIDLDATLEDLGIENGTPLTRSERQATVRNLLQGRSGVYVPALYLGGSLDLPPRGSREPGTYFHYANFDFNTLGTIFELKTGKKLFEEFKLRIADPIQMEDFRVDDGIYWYGNHDDAVNTRLFAYPFRITARDLARFGLLFLREGKWRGQQIIPAEWITQVFTPYSNFAELTGYGFTNWKIHLKGKTLPNGYKLPGEAYWASGVNVHRVYVAPFADLVFVHRINSDIPLRRPSSEQVDRLFGLILDAKLADVDRALLEATAAGDVAAVEGLLDGGAAVNAKDVQGLTALHRAAARWRTTIARELLAHGADVNARTDLGETPIMRPAWNGDTLTVRVLLRARAVVNAREEFMGWTALMSAATRGSSAVVRDLLAAGAEVNARGAYYGETALVLAAASGDVETVRTLVDAGADVGTACTNGVTPLMMAEALGHTEAAGVLSGAGARRDASLLPLSAYLPAGLVASARGGNIWSPPAAQALLGRGATIAADGESALLVAAMHGDGESVQALLGAGADVNAQHAHGWTALALAALSGHTAVVRALLGAGADVDASEDLIGQSALIWAAKAGHEETVTALLEGGAEVDLRDRYAGTALSLAAADGHAAVVEALLAAGADANAVQDDTGTPLAAAVSDGDVATIRALLQAGADVNGTVIDDWTALMIGAMTGKAEVVRMLLDAGADVNARDAFGETALSIATQLDRTEVVDLLTERGATE